MNARDLTGIHIYNQQNKTLFFDIFSHNAYIISNEKATVYTMFTVRFAAAVMLFCCIFQLTSNLTISFLIGCAFLAVIEFIFRYVFLRKLPVFTKFNHTRKTNYINEVAIGTSYLRIALLLMLAVLLFLEVTSIYKSVTSLVEQIICVGINCGVMLFALIYFEVLLSKIKNKY